MLFVPTSLFVWYSVPQGSVLRPLLLRHIIFVDDEELYSSTHRLALILGFVFGTKLPLKIMYSTLKFLEKEEVGIL